MEEKGPRKKKVLHVEDDILLANMYERRLTRDGLEVTIAADGQQAADMLHEGYRPDLILLDIMMPRLNGFQLLQQLGADAKLKKIPVIILTNLLEDEESERRAREFGVKGYHVKSAVTLDDVAASVEKVIKENPVPGEDEQEKGLWKFYG